MSVQVKKRYNLIGVIGDAEDGKTTWAARHMKMELNLPEEERVYTKGFANLHYRNSPEVTFTNYAGLKCLDLATKDGVPQAVAHVDQIHKYCDSINWNTKEAKEFIDTVIECRQHGVDLVMTTWAKSAFHPRIRKFVKLWVGCSQQADGFHYDYYDSDAKTFITPPNGLVLKFEQAQSVWPFFNTGELVNDDTLSKVAHADAEDRMKVARKLAVYTPCA